MPRHKEPEWISPGDAARKMSERAGYVVTPDDLKQMRHNGKFQHVKKITERIMLYSSEEIEQVAPPKKRNPQPLAPRGDVK